MQLLGALHRTVANSFQDTAYFINEHHASQFRKTFPQIWYALEHGINASDQPAFDSALMMLRSIAPTTYLSRQKTGIIS